jgi:uncharacterized protein (TIGR00266 family)
MDAQVRGTTMPVLVVMLDPGESVVAESGQLTWMSEGLELETKVATAGADGVGGALKRTFAGSTLYMTEYKATSAPGSVAFAAQVPGQIFTVPLGPDREYLIQRHGFLAGTTGCELDVAFQPKKLLSGIFGGWGFLLQRLHGTGHAWIELSGELTEYDLEAGQSLLVHPGHIGLIDPGVTYELTSVPGIKNKIFGGNGLMLVRLTGPGKVLLQSLSLPMLARALMPYLPHPTGADADDSAAGDVAGALSHLPSEAGTAAKLAEGIIRIVD